MVDWDKTLFPVTIIMCLYYTVHGIPHIRFIQFIQGEGAVSKTGSAVEWFRVSFESAFGCQQWQVFSFAPSHRKPAEVAFDICWK